MTLFEKLLKEEPTLDSPTGERIKMPTTKRATKYSQSGQSVPMPTDIMADPGEYLQAQKNKITTVKYHATDVFVFDHTAREVTLDTGGWFTVTTKDRMNMMSDKFGLGFSIYQKKGSWFINSNKFPQKNFTGDWITFNVDTGDVKNYKIMPDGEHYE